MTSPHDQQPHQHTNGDAISRRDALRTLSLATGSMLTGSTLLALAGCSSGEAKPSPQDNSSGARPSKSDHGRSAGEQGPTPPPIARECRAVWVATVNNIDWPSKPGLAVEQLRREMDTILDTAARLNLNTVFFQARSIGDAMYQSATEPWSGFLSGKQGEPVADGHGHSLHDNALYDPLQEWIDGAHRRGLSLHAWINPFRASHPKYTGPAAKNHITQRRPDLTNTYGPYFWLDPGEPAARQYVMGVVRELLDNYNVDGIHVDDYFYPYPQNDRKNKPVPFEDSESFARALAKSTPPTPNYTRADWRRDNINTMVQRLHTLTRAAGRGKVFTISPFGIWRPGHPEGVKGLDAYSTIFADSRKWLMEGWCDAMLPQLYWTLDAPHQPFANLLAWWREQARAARVPGTHVWPGLFLTRVQDEDEFKGTYNRTSWRPQEIVNQLRSTRAVGGPLKNKTGWSLFSMVGLTENRQSVMDLLSAQLQEPALMPECARAGTFRFNAPAAAIEQHGSGHVGGPDAQLRLVPSGETQHIRGYTLQWRTRTNTGSAWYTQLIAAGNTSSTVVRTPQAATGADYVSIRAFGPNGSLSKAHSLSVSK